MGDFPKSLRREALLFPDRSHEENLLLELMAGLERKYA